MNFDIQFRQMNDDEFNKFMESSISDYAQDLIKSGRCTEETALECSKKEFHDIVPHGRDTVNNFFYTIVNSENEDVGVIWYEKHSETLVFICDFLISEKFRKRGYGKQALLLLENNVKEKGLKKIALHVFEFNKPAISLYNCLGYKTVKEEPGSIYMVKDI